MFKGICILTVMAALLIAPPAPAATPQNAAYIVLRPPPFGIAEVHGRNISSFYKWAGVVARMARDPAPQRPWLDHPGFAGLSVREKAVAVNDIINSYPDVSDEDNWGVSDYWETPAEFFARGGDCEDYAIAKYAWLRYLGVPEDSLRLAMVYDRDKEELHMLLVVFDGANTLFLDNQVKTIRTRNNFARYWPLYSINRNGWWAIVPHGKGLRLTRQILAQAVTASH